MIVRRCHFSQLHQLIYFDNNSMSIKYAVESLYGYITTKLQLKIGYL